MSARSTATRLLALLGLSLLGGCSESEIVRELRSLQGSEEAVFVCRDLNGDGRPMTDCPDLDGTDDGDASKVLSIYSLVSQTVTNEVAVIDVTGGHVIDTDISVPGYGFLRVGARPVAMAASPGGKASFVATADVGHNGIFALPTRCLDAPKVGQEQRDLTSWPACRLSSTPGKMTVIVEPSTATCDGSEVATTDAARLEDDGVCYASMEQEVAQGGPAGRRMLVVALPDQGELAVIDAQWLLNRAPGTFEDCHIEARIPLKVEVPSGVAQTLPPDLQTTCTEVPIPTAPIPPPSGPRPAGFALSEDRLYVADQAAPVIHVLDTQSGVCAMSELPSLLPMSLTEPTRVVTTRRVAASPMTPSGKRYVYAIDAEDQPGASVMAFDVSPGSMDPTPIVRPGSPELPGEKPDRLAIGSSARDVAFAYRDLPYADPVTGVAEFGVQCDPDPSAPLDSPGALARSGDDYSTGARPGLLRGLFGFVLLTNGALAIVDVEDFDAPCRRPVTTNTSSMPDFRGCSGDPDIGSYSIDGQRTVTDEVSCRVVEPHRFRGATLAINDPDVGVRAPALRGFPQLALPSSGSGTKVEDRPRLLAVPFASPDGLEPVADTDVFVGATRFSTAPDASDPLPVAPNSTESDQAQSLHTVVLPPLQPRSYATDDTVRLVYEGSYAGDRNAGFLHATEGRAGVLEDATLSFCAAGVYDVAAMTDYAQNELGLTEGTTNDLGIEEHPGVFGEWHADYVQITSDLLPEDDAWWKSHDRGECVQLFPGDAESMSPNRDFRVVRAFAGRLEIEPRLPLVSVAQAAACFPTAIKYRLRTGRHWALVQAATGFRHDIVASGTDSACVRSCDPRRKWAKGRVFEISSLNEAGKCRGVEEAADPLALRVGCALKAGEMLDDLELPEEAACVYDQTAVDADGNSLLGAVQIGGPASECIFDGLNSRFAVYRGRAPSVRDSVFSWQTSGGFTPLVVNMANVSVVVSPQTLQFVSQLERMAVVDGASLGLSLIDFDAFVVAKPSPFF